MDDLSLKFAQPIWLVVGLIVCGGIVYLFIRFDSRRDEDLAKLIHLRFRQRLMEGFSPKLRNLKRVIWSVAVLLIFIALARPQKGFEWREVKRKGIDILFAVDTSRSMLAEDLKPNRLERARLGIIDFVAKLEGDRVGLIPFAGSAFALCPLTLDYDAFRESLDALDTDLIPRQGTDLASAIKEAERLFDEKGNNYRVLILLTDGEDLQGDVIDAAKDAAKKGMAIYTVGVGSPEGATMPIQLQNGRTDFVRDEKGQVVKTKLDENTLKKIADETKGLYAPLGRGAEGLTKIYQEKLRLVPKTEQEQRMEKVPLERFEWPLGAAIACLIIEFFMRDRIRQKKMRLTTEAARTTKNLLQATATLVFGMILFSITESRGNEASSGPQDAREVYNQGTIAYSKGDFTKATESLKTSLLTQDLTLQQQAYYNLGNSFYRAGQDALKKEPQAAIKSWEASIKAYQDALALNAADDDARYNQSLVEKKLEELKKEQKKDDQKKDQDQENPDKKDDQKDEKDNKDQDSKNKGNQDKKDSNDDKKERDPKESKDGEDSQNSEAKEDPQKEKNSQKEEKSKENKDTENGNNSNEKDQQEHSGKPLDDQQAADEQSKNKQEAMSNERAAKQEMTPEEAKQLLESLRQDEPTVIPIPPQKRARFSSPDNSTKGKTW